VSTWFTFEEYTAYACDSGSFFTAARLIYVAGKEGYLPSLFGTLNSRLKTPLNAMLLQAAITIVFICFGDGFRSLINFAVVVNWLALFLTVMFPNSRPWTWMN
jgi:amino acid transporter